MTTTIRKPGQFCWINMLTPDTAKSREFFGTVLGWTYRELPGMGHIVLVDGKEVGGLWDLNGPNTPPGTRPYIGVMIKVESADETAAKVAALGGEAKPPFDVMDQGRMAVCFDPNGAEFDVWEARKGPGMAVDRKTHGAPSWFETLTTDPDRAKRFYHALLGWEAWSMPMPSGPLYTSFKLGEEFVAGMMAITTEMGAMKPHWGVYFTVKSVDEAVLVAAGAGGKLVMPVLDIPNVGRMAGISSPQGVMFYVITYVA